ncbi:hypothetical protein [Neobacillus niacini]|uniref:hypothetical protein n=1 Tax=Neobacillus niacini TaxID=86668 RepID=UPI000A6BFB83|nr:hypothetical protein [Neobacillus niacini]
MSSTHLTVHAVEINVSAINVLYKKSLPIGNDFFVSPYYVHFKNGREVNLENQ